MTHRNHSLIRTVLTFSCPFPRATSLVPAGN